MTLLLAFVLVLLFATLVVSVLRLPTRPATLVGLYLFSYANVVLVAEVAATVRMLNPGAFLLLHLALAIAASILWNRTGRPRLIWRSVSIRSVLSGRRALNSLRTHPLLWVLGLGVTVAYLIGAGLILRVPPNNWDSLTYHLSRVGYWLQHNSFYPWPTPDPRQYTFPMNAEIGVMWTVLFVGTDQLAGFVQWSAVAASMAAIAGLSRLFGASRAQAVFAALLWATLPEIILQSTTTQNDLLAGAFFASGIYLLYLGLQSRHNGALLLSGLGLGLALGTKNTILFLVPGLTVTTLMLWFGHGRQRTRQLLVWTGASLTAFLLVGAYLFALNLLVHGGPLGPPTFVSGLVGSNESWPRRLTANIPRGLYQGVDLTGLPDSIAEPLHQIKADVGTRVFSILNVPTDFTPAVGEPGESDLHWRPPVHEDFAAFGPVAFLLLVPAVIYQASIALARKDPFRLGLAVMSVSLFAAICGLSWYPWDNRYLVVAATLSAPFLALCWRSGSAYAIPRCSIVALALLVMGWTTTHNLSKPIVGVRRIWEMDTIERQTINHGSMEPVLRAVERLIPQDATVGTVMGYNDYDYPLFGRRFSRAVVPFYPPPKSIDHESLEEQSIDFVIVADYSGTYVSNSLAGLRTAWNTGPWYILYRGEADFNEWDARLRNLLLEVNRKSVLTLDESLAQGVGVGELTLPPWGEDYPTGFIWLGQGEEQGIKAVLWSDRELMVELAFDVAPGPGRPDPLRTVQLTLESEAGVQREHLQFDRATTIGFAVQLQPGRNDLGFTCLDAATVLQQPDGDSRPLLVRLDLIRVASLFDRTQAGPADSPLAVLDSALKGVVGILPHLGTPPWDTEIDDDGSFLWLGQGDEEGIKAVLWSERELMVELAFDVAPGPGRPDGLRTVQLTLESEAGVQRQRQVFDTSTTVSFAVELQPGRNDLGFTCLDAATVLQQPDGDNRPLLVRLDLIRVASLFDRRQAGPADSPLAVLDSALKGVVGILPHLGTPPWDIEIHDDGSFLWLGQGDEEGIKAVLWSERELMVELGFDVAPGPGRPDGLRTVELTLENEAGVQRQRQVFEMSTTVSFAVELQPGRNDLGFTCLDEATVLQQPNGDTRPLLVRLDGITVASPLSRGQAGPADFPLVVLDSALKGLVGILPHLGTPPWDVEFDNEGSLLWLGQGDEQGIKAVLWSDRELMVQLAFDVAPGPGRPDALRTVYLTLENEAGVQRQRQVFDMSTTVSFAVELQPGRNQFSFGCLDEATVLEQPNGDTRPLLVLLREVRIEPLTLEGKGTDS